MIHEAVHDQANGPGQCLSRAWLENSSTSGTGFVFLGWADRPVRRQLGKKPGFEKYWQ